MGLSRVVQGATGAFLNSDVSSKEKLCLLVTTDSKAWFLSGTHVGLYGSNSSEGAWLYDPNGSYLGSKGFRDQIQVMTDNLVKENDSKWSFSIEDYATYHRGKDKEHLRVTCVAVSMEDLDKIREEAFDFGEGGAFSCGTSVSGALHNSGLFPGMNSSFWPNKIKFPSNIKTTTKIID